MIKNQAYIFLIFIVNGITIGLLFDFFRILRKTFKTKDYITYIEDFLFWILTGFTILYTTFNFNDGEIRLFMIFGIIIGTIIYMVFLSSYVIKINVTIINFIKNILSKIFNILSFPFVFIFSILKKVFAKPILFFTINIRKISTKISKNISINFKKPKKI